MQIDIQIEISKHVYEIYNYIFPNNFCCLDTCLEEKNMIFAERHSFQLILQSKNLTQSKDNLIQIFVKIAELLAKIF